MTETTPSKNAGFEPVKLQLWLANSFACCGAPSSNVQISFIDRQIYFADSKARPAAPSSGHVASCVSLEQAYLAHPRERWRHAAHSPKCPRLSGCPGFC